MFNDLIDLLRETGVQWKDPVANGVPLLKSLQKALWYVDGHHGTLADKASKIPDLFVRFCGYNCQSLHKHRKQQIGNLSRSELRENALELQDHIQRSWFKKESFCELREATEALVMSLNLYAAYLQEKSKQQKLHNELHRLLVQVNHHTCNTFLKLLLFLIHCIILTML